MFKSDIAILRLIAIIIVASFHVYGMTYANHLPAEVAGIYKDMYDSVNKNGAINIAMPMFVVISGYLFAMQIVAGKIKGFKYMLMGKAKRILLPFFFFTIIFSMTYSGWSWQPFYQWTYWHLWFLPMLFWLFVISYTVRTKLLQAHPVWLLVACVITFFLTLPDKFIPPYNWIA